MRVKSGKHCVKAEPWMASDIRRHNEARARGEKVLDVLPVSSAKPTLPRVKFLEGKDDVK